MAAYSAFLISSLAVQHQHLPFRDLQGLLHDGSYRLGVLRNTSYFNNFDVWGIYILWPDYLIVVGLGWRDKVVRGEKRRIKRVLFVNYVKPNWGFEFIQITKNNFEKINPMLGCSEDILSAAMS